MTTRSFTVMTLVLALTSGCFVGKAYSKMGKVYGKAVSKTYGRLVPSLPKGAGAPAVDGQVVADASTLFAACATCSEPRQLTVNRVDEPDEQPAPAPAPARSSQRRSDPQVSYTHTVTQAPRYPSSPFIAIYPVSRGSNTHVCKQFQESADNKNDCMVECRSQLVNGPGSCSCNEMERCPDGVRVVR
jgi:hypothetical protein